MSYKQKAVAALEAYQGKYKGLSASIVAGCIRIIREIPEDDGWVPVTETSGRKAMIADKDNYVSSTWGDAITVQDIDNAPTVDAVEVVRCKDCKRSEVWGTEKRVGHEATYSRVCLCFWRLKRVRDDDFCSYGERRNYG